MFLAGNRKAYYVVRGRATPEQVMKETQQHDPSTSLHQNHHDDHDGAAGNGDLLHSTGLGSHSFDPPITTEVTI